MAKKNPQKESLKTILKALIPYWNLAEWFLTIVEQTNDKELENQILSMIYKWVKSITSEKDRTKIKNKINEMQKKNDFENQKDQEEADKILDDFINNIEN